MFQLTSTLIFIAAVGYNVHAEHKLECPYESKNKGLDRIWCKRDAKDQNCCTGFSFTSRDRELDGELLSVQDDGKAFTVTVKSLPQGEGVYWCGLKNGSDTVIRLAEKKLYNSVDFTWGILRWLLFVLLMLSVVSTHMCFSRKKAKVFQMENRLLMQTRCSEE